MSRSPWRKRRRFKVEGSKAGQLRKITYLCEDCNGFVGHSKDAGMCPNCGSLRHIRFDSHLEATRWGQLLLMKRAGHVESIERQYRFDLFAHSEVYGAVKVGQYVADFVYIDLKDPANLLRVVEDVKPEGGWTDLADWKLRHFEAQYGFPVKVITP